MREQTFRWEPNGKQALVKALCRWRVIPEMSSSCELYISMSKCTMTAIVILPTPRKWTSINPSSKDKVWKYTKINVENILKILKA